jgi:3-phosphoshikimate 1-carboxyvinyltransferase
MATAVAALGAKGNTIIQNAEAVKKSYPDFYKDLKKIKTNSNSSKNMDVI